MARRGHCRCGFPLKARRGKEGYKTRCPSCGANVRLRRSKKNRRPIADRPQMTCSCGAVVVLQPRPHACPCCGKAVPAPQKAAAPLTPGLPDAASPRILDLFEESRLAAATAVPRAQEPVACSYCGDQVPARAAKCPWCGTPRRAAHETPPLGQSTREMWAAPADPDQSLQCSLVRRVLNAGTAPLRAAFRWLLRA